MNIQGYAAVVLGGVLVLAGCAENRTRIGEGVGFGGILGAAAGGIIGHQGGHGWEGALIGGAAGAAGGAMVGSQMEKQPNVVEAPPVVASANGPSGNLTMQNIVDMSKQGVSGDTIISQIQSTRSTYVLTADDISYLRSNGVSQRVIEAMQAAR